MVQQLPMISTYCCLVLNAWYATALAATVDSNKYRDKEIMVCEQVAALRYVCVARGD